MMADCKLRWLYEIFKVLGVIAFVSLLDQFWPEPGWSESSFNTSYYFNLAVVYRIINFSIAFTFILS